MVSCIASFFCHDSYRNKEVLLGHIPDKTVVLCNAVQQDETVERPVIIHMRFAFRSPYLFFQLVAVKYQNSASAIFFAYPSYFIIPVFSVFRRLPIASAKICIRALDIKLDISFFIQYGGIYFFIC